VRRDIVPEHGEDQFDFLRRLATGYLNKEDSWPKGAERLLRGDGVMALLCTAEEDYSTFGEGCQ